MKEISTEITIQATKADVWNVLTDFRSYPRWNPFIQEIKGDLKVGSKLELKIVTPKKRIRKYTPVVTLVSPNSELRWHGKAFMPGLLDGERIFRLSNEGETLVRFEHKEIFGGIGALIGSKFLAKDIFESENNMNQALKLEVESKNKTMADLR
ncbi:MAG TPA: SRPBCC domain-containing protein [Nitrososphaeraceae archaeon]|jgi:hypothetical protein